MQMYGEILNSIDANITDVLHQAWPMILISVILISSVRIAHLYNKKEKFVLHKELLLLSFIVYILCLFRIVTYQDITIAGGNNFIPFKEILRYEFGARLFVKNIIGNVLLFVPYGFFTALYVDIKKGRSAFFLILLASFAIEFTQLGIGRVFDVDDIILNVLGGMVGFYIFRILDKISDHLPKVFKSKLVLDILSILVFGVIIAYVIWRL